MTAVDVIDTLLSNEPLLMSISEILSHFLDVDQLIHRMQLVQISKGSCLRGSQTVIRNIIGMKHILALAPKVAHLLQDVDNPILQSIAANLKHASLLTLHQDIEAILNQDTQYSKSTYHMRMQQCFAVKMGINPLLDVARKTYTETIEDMNLALNRYKQELDIASLKLQYHAKRGHFIVIDNPPPSLPPLFIQVAKQGRKVHCSTQEISSLSRRNDESLNEILLMTDRVLEELVHRIRSQVGAIYKMSDSIALLDMLLSLTTYVTLSKTGCVRPEFTEDGAMVIKQGRHPIMERISEDAFIPNDTYISDTINFQMITGPNMSGKSTYIRQVALMNIMAHIGSYVPAQYASFRLVDRLFTRIGTGDSIEANNSTFMREMIEMTYIINNATDKSLIVIDELGRGTSNRDGVALSFSVCEHLLLHLKSHIFFVTHFLELVELETIYPNAKNYHLTVDSTQDSKLKFMFQVMEGSIVENSYGIDMAEKAGFDPQLIREAREISTLFVGHKTKGVTAQGNKYALAQRLLHLKKSSLEMPQLREYLQSLQKQYQMESNES
eukprot:TRINITY_DN5333_c0_g1_i3.p2 TRINITY_DN5333_c0_g1~~TRINITY_DN5333_c0_g1_i3.p2  ORF type:complete len:554 (-),score=161.96 TRINITY_DN5333_c0_g1_i3:2031-3692(-)